MSTVTAPPVGDMPCGGRYTSIFSVFGSTLASPPLVVVMLNQRFPSASRVMPCVLAAIPPAFGTIRNLTAPVLASMRPTVTFLLGLLTVNHRFPSRSDQASWTSTPIFDGVPSDQSWPSLLRTGALSASGGTS